jgi:benzoyl-CoA reductase/2-hydroxyglutaryl-CoA dehydratase subunit BcrC/BadD/HgdB
VETVLQQTAWAGIIAAATCDQMRRSADALCRSTGPAVFLLRVPCRAETPTATPRYRAELERLGRSLVDWGGQAPTRQALRRIMEHYDRQRQRLRDLRGQVSARAWARASRNPSAIGPGCGPRPPSGHPVALVGSPLAWNALSLLDTLEAAGARLVWDATANGEGGLCRPFDREGLARDPESELARAYRESIGHIGSRPNTGYFTWLRRHLDRHRIRGLLVHRQPWCDLWHAELPRLRELVDVPVLDLESTGGDPGRQGRLVTRIQAFVETLA